MTDCGSNFTGGLLNKHWTLKPARLVTRFQDQRTRRPDSIRSVHFWPKNNSKKPTPRIKENLSLRGGGRLGQTLHALVLEVWGMPSAEKWLKRKCNGFKLLIQVQEGEVTNCTKRLELVLLGKNNPIPSRSHTLQGGGGPPDGPAATVL